MSGEVIVEELAKFIEALVEDEDLRAWFEHLAEVAETNRRAEFTRISAEMRHAGEHAELIRATALLAEPAVYEAVRQTVAETRAGKTA